MLPDLSHIFVRYEQLRDGIDQLFQKVASQHESCMGCRPGCSDCCNGLFDLSLVEAMYINASFKKKFDYGPLRSAILERASLTDRKLTRLKRAFFQQEKTGQRPREIMETVSGQRVACPLLENNACLMYESRPITCRLYGIPTAFGGESHVCGFSRFAKGLAYPTVNLEKVQLRLAALSREIAAYLKSGFSELHEVYVPLPMALLTNYDESYLGINQSYTKKRTPGKD